MYDQNKPLNLAAGDMNSHSAIFDGDCGKNVAEFREQARASDEFSGLVFHSSHQPDGESPRCQEQRPSEDKKENSRRQSLPGEDFQNSPSQEKEQQIPHKRSFLHKLDREYFKLLAQSVAAGILSYGIALGVCMAVSWTATSPLQTALITTAVGFPAYVGIFSGFSLFRRYKELKQESQSLTKDVVKKEVSHTLKILGAKEVCEAGLRAGLHYAFMTGGIHPALAYTFASMISGSLGHMTVPLLSKHFKRK